jgi:hypothetical protein
MKKQWKKPELLDLSIKNTESGPFRVSVEDTYLFLYGPIFDPAKPPRTDLIQGENRGDEGSLEWGKDPSKIVS